MDVPPLSTRDLPATELSAAGAPSPTLRLPATAKIAPPVGSVAPRVLGGRYRLDGLIGRGGMGEVFRAHDLLLDRTVAIKVFREDSAVPEVDRRNAGEIRVLAGLNHPNLVTLFDAGTDQADPCSPAAYLVMEIVDGITLAQRLAEAPMGSAEAAEIGAQVATALAHVHERGIVHRDVKPANVLLARPDRAGEQIVAKLTDFGIARLLDGTRLTLHGTTLGTPNYLSPEQASGAEVGPASDIYALGLILIECLTGSVAFPGHGIESAVARLHRGPDVPAGFGPAWHGLLEAMTAGDPARRPSAAEVTAALRRIVLGDTEPMRFPAGPRHRRAVVALAVAAAAAVVALLAAFALGGGSSSSTRALEYPSVAGVQGSHLRALQDAVGSATGNADVARLQADTLALTRDVARRDWTAARADIAALSSDLRSAVDRSAVSAKQYASIQSALSLVSADVSAATRAATAPSTPGAATTSSPGVSTSAAQPAAPQPPQPPGGSGHAKGGGKKKGK